MEKIVLKGRGVMPGKVKGEALVCPESIASFGGIIPETGIITDYDSSQKGKSFKDKILVVPGSMGSNGWSCYFTAAHMAKAGPKAIIITKVDSSSGVAIACMKIPSVVDFTEEMDPVRSIENGDIVTVDGESGEIIIEKQV